MPKLDLDAIPHVSRTSYPAPFAVAVAGRTAQRLTVPAGLQDFAVNIITLQPGAWSSQRHWHDLEDEFVVMIEGKATLVDDSGRTPMSVGDCATFPKGDGNGHHLINDSDAPARFMVIGVIGNPGACHYPDIDLHLDGESHEFCHKDGRRWE